MAMQDPVVQPTQCREYLDYPADEPVTELELQRRDLLARYEQFVHQRQGHGVTGYLITPPQSQDRLPVELFDLSARELVVACPTLDRSGGGRGVWYAIGTLLDLRRFLPPDTHSVLLLPGQPDEDLAGLCASRGIEPVWPTFDAFIRA